MLALLVLVEGPPPSDEAPPTFTVSLERPEAVRTSLPVPPSRMLGQAGPLKSDPSIVASRAEAGVLASPAAPPARIDPGWTVGKGEYLTPESGARARKAWEAMDQLRYKRACMGLSDEHMTPEEKDRCWDAWGGAAPAADKRIGPKAEVPRPFDPLTQAHPADKGRLTEQARKQERCRAYRKHSLPGTISVPPPLLRGGGCL